MRASGVVGIESPHQFVFPLLQQRPINGAGPEIGHVLKFAEAINCFLELLPIFSENGPMAWKQPVQLGIPNPFERLNKRGKV